MLPRVGVTACDKRKAFAHGSASDEAIQLFSLTLDCFAEPVIGRALATAELAVCPVNQ